MRSVKIFGLAAVAAVAAMAFIGANTASALDNVVLCSKLPIPATELCNKIAGGELLAPGTKVLAIDEGADPILKGTLNEKCEESHVEGSIGSPGASLLGTITLVSFTKNCTPCATVEMQGLPYEFHLLHVGGGQFVLDVLLPKAKIFNCTGGFECVFGASNVSVDVQDNSGQLLVDSLKAPLNLITGSKILCGSTGEWIATYKLECKDVNTNATVPCWPALDEVK